MTLKRVGAAAISLMAIAAFVTYISGFFVLASDFQHFQGQQALLDKYQSDDIDEIRLAKEFGTLADHVTNLRTIEDMEEWKPLSDTDRGYKAMLRQNIRGSIRAIKKLGGSTEEIELILGDDG